MSEHNVCDVCGESKVVDMSGWCVECYDAEEDEVE
jgi:hypothetical protein